MKESAVSKKDEMPADDNTTWVCTVCGYVHTGFEPPYKCPKCGEYNLNHRVCASCGYYNGEEIIHVEEK